MHNHIFWCWWSLCHSQFTLKITWIRLCGSKASPYYPLANEVAKGYSNATFRPSFRNILVNTRINILQWILTKLGTYLRESGTLLIFKVKVQGHWVKFLGDGIRHALRCPCFTCFRQNICLLTHPITFLTGFVANT